MAFDISILTDKRYLNPKPNSDYIRNVLNEDRLLSEALEQKGLKVQRLNWDDPEFDWTDTKYVLFRSTWDYFDRIVEFEDWLEKVKHKCTLINDYALIKWNMNKHYLKDIEKEGLPIPPTIFIEKNDELSLQDKVLNLKWEEIILKPVVGATARHTYKFAKENTKEFETLYKELIQQESMLLQEYQKRITTEGEISLIFIGETYSHAVLKRAKMGDFRVQDDFGGSVHPYTANQDEIALAKALVEMCKPKPIYARVDMMRSNSGDLYVSELELFEPELWFRFNPDASQLLANEIQKMAGNEN
jgi:glutathione synthase/RimK-type ligase-like ATP-grasp enzyme